MQWEGTHMRGCALVAAEVQSSVLVAWLSTIQAQLCMLLL
jgi:hypothetical protein